MSSDNIVTIDKLMSSPFESGGLTVNFNQNRVSYQHSDLVLQPKVLELLVLLCAAQGKTLSKETLTLKLWPNTIVGPDSLANTVTRLRKVLCDDAKNPEFVETVQRKGYRWRQSVNLINPRETKKIINKANIAIFFSVVLAGILGIALSSGGLFSASVNPVVDPVKSAASSEKFPFPDLYIERLAEGGYEIQVGIEGELTEARKAAMLKEIRRITGEEHSDMTFTVDPVEPSCKKGNSIENSGEKLKAACTDKPLTIKPKD